MQFAKNLAAGVIGAMILALAVRIGFQAEQQAITLSTAHRA